MKCPECNGKGEILEYHEPNIGTYFSDCWQCRGRGKITIRNHLSTIFWRDIAPVWFVEWYAEKKLGHK